MSKFDMRQHSIATNINHMSQALGQTARQSSLEVNQEVETGDLLGHFTMSSQGFKEIQTLPMQQSSRLEHEGENEVRAGTGVSGVFGIIQESLIMFELLIITLVGSLSHDHCIFLAFRSLDVSTDCTLQRTSDGMIDDDFIEGLAKIQNFRTLDSGVGSVIGVNQVCLKLVSLLMSH